MPSIVQFGLFLGWNIERHFTDVADTCETHCEGCGDMTGRSNVITGTEIGRRLNSANLMTYV
jgi:hypothetical protein